MSISSFQFEINNTNTFFNQISKEILAQLGNRFNVMDEILYALTESYVTAEKEIEMLTEKVNDFKLSAVIVPSNITIGLAERNSSLAVEIADLKFEMTALRFQCLKAQFQATSTKHLYNELSANTIPITTEEERADHSLCLQQYAEIIDLMKLLMIKVSELTNVAKEGGHTHQKCAVKYLGGFSQNSFDALQP